MFKHLTGARLGLFVFLGTILLVIAIFLVGNKESLFTPTFTAKAMFNNIEGLRVGAAVRMSGIDVGSVSDIEIAKDTTGKVIVSMRIQSEVRNFIRIDSKASIETEGLVGNKIVVLTVGSTSAKVVAEGGFITSKSPLSIAQIIEESQGTLNYIKEISKDFSEIVNKINRGDGTIGKLINDDQLYNSTNQLTVSADKSLSSITSRMNQIGDAIVGVTADFQNIVTGIDSIVKKIDGIVATVKEGKGVLGSLVSEKSSYNDSVTVIVRNLLSMTDGIKTGATKFAENMEALKHNWLFKSYFEERGYWDIGEYEKSVDSKIQELKDRTRTLDERIKQLQEIERRTGGSK
ncbi:MAG: MlaD family protein [Ignavibacteriales bacterium]|nr:MlaD family protein [Ignavibacteriales bacterium]